MRQFVNLSCIKLFVRSLVSTLFGLIVTKCLLIFFTAVVLLSISCNNTIEIQDEYQSNIVEGDKVPQFQVVNVDGSLLSSNELLGKRSIIVFFIISCPYCRALMPVVEDVWLNTKEFEDVSIIPVGRGETVQSIGTYWESENLTMPAFIDTNRKMYDKFAETGVPRIYISDKNGIVIWKALGTEGVTVELLMSKLFPNVL